MKNERQKLTAERVSKLNFERHAKDAAKSIRDAVTHLAFAYRSAGDNSDASAVLPKWQERLQVMADEIGRDVHEDFVTRRLARDGRLHPIG